MRACLHVGNEATNDMILGKPAFADGGRVTDLRYNIDCGTCVVNSGFKLDWIFPASPGEAKLACHRFTKPNSALSFIRPTYINDHFRCNRQCI
jgi:hypothetical protein